MDGSIEKLDKNLSLEANDIVYYKKREGSMINTI